MTFSNIFDVHGLEWIFMMLNHLLHKGRALSRFCALEGSNWKAVRSTVEDQKQAKLPGWRDHLLRRLFRGVVSSSFIALLATQKFDNRIKMTSRIAYIRMQSSGEVMTSCNEWLELHLLWVFNHNIIDAQNINPLLKTCKFSAVLCSHTLYRGRTKTTPRHNFLNLLSDGLMYAPPSRKK